MLTQFKILLEEESHAIISPFEDKKILLPASCAVCGAQGMAYTDPKAGNNLHYCHKHLGGKT
jgi:hypothetical protein